MGINGLSGDKAIAWSYTFPLLVFYTLLFTSGAAQWVECFGYGLDDQAIAICFSAEARYVSLTQSVQTDYAAHPASCSIETKGSLPGQDVNIATHIHLAQRSRKCGPASLLNSIL
jgi:hypothetical protein